MKCNQCEMLQITMGGISQPCHEHGCPNAYKDWDEESQEWVSRPVEDEEFEDWWEEEPDDEYDEDYQDQDPRGPDNTVSVWINESNELVIQVLKADRCYRFDRVEQDAASIRVIAKP